MPLHGRPPSLAHPPDDTRALRNRFIDDHDTQAVAGFPNVAFLTGPVFAAAARSGDPQGTGWWAGTASGQTSSAPAAAIVAKLLSVKD
jgi:nitronate monooxygenase